MLRTPIFRPNLHVQIVDGQSVILLSDDDSTLLHGRLYALVAPLIDGRRTTDEMVEALSDKASMAEVFFALMQLEKPGYVLEAAEWGLPAAAAFWGGLGANPGGAQQNLSRGAVEVVAFGDVEPTPMVEALRSLSLPIQANGDITVVLTDDYLRPQLREFNDRALKNGRPWLLVKPSGTTLWIGPLFVPGKTGCWACLAHRLEGHREVERFVVQQQGRDEPIVLSLGNLSTTLGAASQLAATEVARWIATGNSALKGTVRTLDLRSWEMESHTMMRRPQCPVCGQPSADQPQPVVLQACHKRAGDRSLSPEEVLARFGRHVSPIAGAVGALVRTTDKQDSVMHSYAAGHNMAIPQSSVDRLRKHMRNRSGGKGISDAHARASALCEALERHSGLFQGYEPRTRGSYQELGEAAIHPNLVLGFSEAQYRGREAWNAQGRPFHYIPEPFDPDRQIDWSPLWSLTHQRPMYLPTQYLYYGYPSQAGEHFAKADSNGNAAGATREEAIYQGLMELIERDSVAIWWYNRIRRPAVDLASFGDPYIGRLTQRYRELGREVWVLDLTADLGVPAFAAVSRQVGVQPEGIMVGFGAHLDAKVAVIRALTELNQFLPTVSALVDGKAEDSDSDLVHWWRTATLENQPYLVPLDGPARRAGDFPLVYHEDVADDIRYVQRILEAKGMELLVLDQTRPDIGLPVVKVVVPGLRHFWARFGPGRLYDVPVKLGWLRSPTPEADLNPIPLFV